MIAILLYILVLLTSSHSYFLYLFNSRQIATLPALQTVVESVERAGVAFDVFDRVRIEPSDASMRDAIEFAKAGQFDSYIAVGGGSVMDTAKVANLYSTFPQHGQRDHGHGDIRLQAQEVQDRHLK